MAATKEENRFPMDTENPSAPTRAQSRTAGKNHPHAGGLLHDHTRHTTRFTLVPGTIAPTGRPSPSPELRRLRPRAPLADPRTLP
jgi:hypothetical protein